MAHLAKFTGGSEGKNMYAHWSREKDENGEYITYSREHGGGHINRELTKNNFTIGEIHNREWIAERLKSVYQKPNQKRPIETCDIVVTLPQSESTDLKNVKQFMQAAYNSLKKQYGNNNNIVGCWVHLDEAQPHMHFAFLPISKRNSIQKPEFKEKLSTHTYWPKKNSLQIMHRNLQKDIDAEMGRHIEGINDGITKEQGGNKTIVELKKETQKEQRKLEYYRAKPEELDKLHGTLENPWVGDKYYKLTPNQYHRLRNIAENSIKTNQINDDVQKENTLLKKENAELKKWINYYLAESDKKAEKKITDNVDNLKKENRELKSKKSELLRENKSLSSALRQTKKDAILYKNFILDNAQTKKYTEWYNALPNNAKSGEPDDMEKALENWKYLSQARRDEKEMKKYLEEVHCN